MVSKKCYSIRNKTLKKVETNFWDPFLRFSCESVIQKKTRKTRMILSLFFTTKSSNIFPKKKAFSPKKQFGKVQDEFAESKKKDGKNAQFVHKGKNTFSNRHFVTIDFEKMCYWIVKKFDGFITQIWNQKIIVLFIYYNSKV